MYPPPGRIERVDHVPPRPPILSTARVNMAYSNSDEIGGHVAENVFYMQGPGDWMTPTTLADCAQKLSSAWGSNIKSLTSSVVGLSSVTLTAVDGTEDQGSYNTPVAGTGAATMLTSQVAACISWDIGAAYRGGHPRLYMPGIFLAQVNGYGANELIGTVAASMSVAWTAFLTAANDIVEDSISLGMGTVSYRTGNAPRVTPIFRFYSGCRVNTRLATQRRRLGKLSVGTYET